MLGCEHRVRGRPDLGGALVWTCLLDRRGARRDSLLSRVEAIVAGLPSGDPPVTNGRVEGLQGNIAASSQTLEDEQSLSDSDQSLAESEQTLADSDQTLSDADQTGSDSDQTSADCDQLASDRDQQASDRDLASGADEDTHDASQAVRERSAQRRDQTGNARMDTGEQRDEIASTRDLAALARDQAADVRDRTMAQREFADEQDDGGRTLSNTGTAVRASGRRKRVAQHYAQAAEYRALAAEDRQAAAQDREQAARDRLGGATDPLTGARAQAAGLTDVDHELDRCRRTYGRLVVAFVELVVNDTDRHHPSDEMLKRVTALITSQLRSYDLVIRLDGDQLVRAMSNMTVPDARERFTAIAAAITDSSDEGTILTGYADMAPDETATELIARAEHDLVASRDGHQDIRPTIPAHIGANGHR